MTTQISSEILIELYKTMLLIRRTEEAIAARYPEQEMRCPTHLCIGQEAIAAGVCAHLETSDTVFSNHRGHGHYLAKGGSLKKMIAELYGKATGSAGGYGGSMHLSDKLAGFTGCVPIVGGTVPLAVGSAWGSMLKGERAISVTFFGDGCFEEGVMHESMNFAVLKKIPVLFVCENNGLSVFTSLKERQPERSIIGVARAHGLKTWSGDGNHACEVYRISKEAIHALRNGGGPQFLEFATYRWLEHCGPYADDHLGYRSPEDVERGKSECPILRLKTRLLERGVLSERGFDDIEGELKSAIDEAFEFALTSPAPDYKDVIKKVYAK